MSEPPDFNAGAHTRFRKKLAAVIEFTGAGNFEGLRAFAINPLNSSLKAIFCYRDLCIIALEAWAG